jgi:AraC-like DNA-binding protein
LANRIGPARAVELRMQPKRERAWTLLSAPDASVTRVALELGFADSSALAHACQRWFACTPGELKRRRD